MTAERHQRITELFAAACELDPAEREAYLERACSDATLRAEVAALLDHDSRPRPHLSTTDARRGRLIQQAFADAQHTGSAAPSQHIGPYKLLEKIGTGGMGEVWAADQLEPVRRRVALKLIKPGMDSAQVLARFEAERQALALMSHPNVAQVFDGGTTDTGRPYFVMEYVAGEPITEYCDRHKLSTRERVQLFLGVCGGVQHAHQKGIVHRDLKPSNLLVAHDGGHASPKIIDFGVARAVTGRLGEHTLHTLMGQVLGTLDYMSPEQADPTCTDIDTRSDIYSLGVVLYQLVSGLLPFDFATGGDRPLSAAQHTLREQDPSTPSTRLRRATGTATSIASRRGTDERGLVRELHGDLDWICIKALEKDPVRRYASASELADDLRRHLAHEPVLAGRPGTLYRLGKFVRRHRIAVAAGVLVAAALSTAAGGVISGRLEAATKGEALLRLSDGYRLEELLVEADGLWPAHPERIADLEDWLVRARALYANLPDHTETLAAMRATATPAEAQDPPTWTFATAEEQWQHDLLAKLVAGLQSLATGLLAEDGATLQDGWSVPRRLAFAQELEARCAPGGDLAAAWESALPAIQQRYPGLDLVPQMGLVPLGPDPRSGLWEFAELMSGVPSVRGDDGALAWTENTGLVLVLLPGGEFLMGAQAEDPGLPNFDPGATPGEGPVHAVRVEPFFLAKHELARSQWQRFMGQRFTPGKPANDKPAIMVTWTASDRCARRLGLALPDEQQWEYSARGGRGSIWWTGDELASLRGAANLLDAQGTARPGSSASIAMPLPWDDGFQRLAPVDSLAPNPFGLHHVLGNVSEWTASHPSAYDRAPDAPAPGGNWYMARGGNYISGADVARSAFRSLSNDADFVNMGLGLRLARAVQR